MPVVQCPNCGKAVEWNSASRWRPFCCERCRLIDLGEWVSETHRIAGDSAASEDEPADDTPDQTT